MTAIERMPPAKWRESSVNTRFSRVLAIGIASVSRRYCIGIVPPESPVNPSNGAFLTSVQNTCPATLIFLFPENTLGESPQGDGGKAPKQAQLF